MTDPDKGAARPLGHLSPEEISEFKRRADELGGRIDDAQAEKLAEIEAQKDRTNRSRGMTYGLRMSTELVAAIIVGGFIGFMLDQWLGTKPWLFLIFLLMGFVAGVRSVLRTFERVQSEIARETKGDIGKPIRDDDD